jgi:hypothetical protein
MQLKPLPWFLFPYSSRTTQMTELLNPSHNIHAAGSSELIIHSRYSKPFREHMFTGVSPELATQLHLEHVGLGGKASDSGGVPFVPRPGRWLSWLSFSWFSCFVSGEGYNTTLKVRLRTLQSTSFPITTHQSPYNHTLVILSNWQHH